MKHIGNLQYSEGSKHRKKRIGRGEGSGYGGTSTRGHKGQKSRKSYKHPRGFEGGQMPLLRRIPKFGFNNRNRKEYQIVNVGQLQKLFDDGKIQQTIGVTELIAAGLLNNKNLPLKILGEGELTVALNITADKFSETAKQKIESAGGTIRLNG